MLQPFPQYDASQVDEAALADTEWLKQAIVAVRNIRAEMNIAPGKPLELLLRGCSADAERRVNENRGFLQTLARLESITVLPADDKGPVSVTKIIDGAELLCNFSLGKNRWRKRSSRKSVRSWKAMRKRKRN